MLHVLQELLESAAIFTRSFPVCRLLGTVRKMVKKRSLMDPAPASGLKVRLDPFHDVSAVDLAIHVVFSG